MPNNIEDTNFNTGLPVNTRAMIARLDVLLKDNQTNCLSDCRDDVRVQRLMWLLNGQMYGQLAVIDMSEEWIRLEKEMQKGGAVLSQQVA